MSCEEIEAIRKEAKRTIAVCDRALILVRGYYATGVMRLPVFGAAPAERRLETAADRADVPGVAWSFAQRMTP